MHTQPLSVPDAARKFGMKYTTLKSWINFGYLNQTGEGRNITLSPEELDRLEVLAALVEVGFLVGLAADLIRPNSRSRDKLHRALEALERWQVGLPAQQPSGG